MNEINFIKPNKSYENIKMNLDYCKMMNDRSVSNWYMREERKAKKYAKNNPEFDLNGRLEDIDSQARKAWDKIEKEYNERLAALNAKFNIAK